MAKNPSTWDDYEYGRSPRQGSIGSVTSRVHFEDEAPGHDPDGLGSPSDARGNGTPDGDLRRRRSSIAMRVNALAQVGGVNSIESFARSWQRAIGFHEITPSRSSFLIAEGEGPYGKLQDEEQAPTHHKSLLRQQIERDGTPPSAVEEHVNLSEALGLLANEERAAGSPRGEEDDVLSQASYLGSPFSSSYSGTYGSLTANLNETSRKHAARLFRAQQATGMQEPDKECEPLLVKRVEQEDGKIVLAVVGQSTIYQTILNSTNVLIGVGLLSLPLGIKYAGWLVGLLFLAFSALTTGYTASLLAKCLDLDNSLISFADIAFISFGPRAKVVIGTLFSFELLAACVALFVLFADSLNALVPGWGLVEWKLICGIIVFPLSFVPLRLLGYSSSLGIVCCLGIVILVVIDGLLKPHAPGSLREPALTYLFPQSWMTLPLSFGLIMSPWGGHSVFPNIYRDMRHPKKYGKGLKVTFGFTYLLNLSMAVVGLLMFGDVIMDEVTSNIFTTDGYPRAISITIVICIGILPLTKIPLNSRPIFTTVESYFGLDPRRMPDSSSLTGISGFSRGLFKCLIRGSITVVMTILAILCPSFDRVMALMGSAFCFTICIILPLAFYLKLFWKEITMREKIIDWFLIVICSAMAALGTVWAFLPKA